MQLRRGQSAFQFLACETQGPIIESFLIYLKRHLSIGHGIGIPVIQILHEIEIVRQRRQILLFRAVHVPQQIILHQIQIHNDLFVRHRIGHQYRSRPRRLGRPRHVQISAVYVFIDYIHAPILGNLLYFFVPLVRTLREFKLQQIIFFHHADRIIIPARHHKCDYRQ